MNSSKQIKLGALISYFSIVFNMISGLIYTPWMITQIGQSNYGLYTLTTSFISLFIMDFGISAAVSRFASKYKAEDNQQAMNDFLGIAYKLYLLIDGVILTVLIVASFFIDRIYDNLSSGELETFKILYIIVALFSVIAFPFTNLNGILTAHEMFTEIKLVDLFHKVFIIFAMVIALLMGYGVYALVIVNAVAGLLTIAIKLIVVHRKTAVRVNFKYKDKKLLKDIFSFSMWTTVSSLAMRLVFNITPSIITAVSVTGTIGVAIFGLAQTIEGYVYTFSTAINGMFMTRVSVIVHKGKKDIELMDLMIKVGRIQCMIVGMLVTGFISFGKSFITDVWNKPDFVESYICAVLLIVPIFFFLPLQIANTTIIVENKVKVKAISAIIVGIVNVVLSSFFSRFWGAFGASLSICIAYFLDSFLMVLICMKVLNLKMLRFYKETYFKIVPLLIIITLLGLLLEYFNPMIDGIIRFGVNGLLFVVAFVVIMLLFFMNEYEKQLILSVIKKMLEKFGIKI